MDQSHPVKSHSGDGSYQITSTEAKVSDIHSLNSDNEGSFEDFEEVTIDGQIDYQTTESLERYDVTKNKQESHHKTNIRNLDDLQSDDDSDIEKYIISDVSNPCQPSNDHAQLSTKVKKLCFDSIEPSEYLMLKDYYDTNSDSDSKTDDEKNETVPAEISEESDASYIWDADETVEKIRDQKHSDESNDSYKDEALYLSPPIKKHTNKFNKNNHDSRHSEKTKKILKTHSSKNKLNVDSSDSEYSNQDSLKGTQQVKRKILSYDQSRKLSRSRSTQSTTRYRTGKQSTSVNRENDQSNLSKKRIHSKNGALKRHSESDENSYDKSNAAKRPTIERKNSTDKATKRSASLSAFETRKRRNRSDSEDGSDSDGSTYGKCSTAKRSRAGSSKVPRRSKPKVRTRDNRRSDLTDGESEIPKSESESEGDGYRDRGTSRRSRSKTRKALGNAKICKRSTKVRKAKLSDPEYAASSSAEESDSPLSSDDQEDDSAKENDAKNRKSSKRHSYEKPLQIDKDSMKHMFKYVPPSSQGGKHYYKKNCCPYCRKMFSRLDIHLLGKRNGHRDKRTVQKILEYDPRDPRRIELFSLLRNHGNAQFNRDRKLNPTGMIISARRTAINKGRPLEHKPHLSRKNVTINENADKSAPTSSSHNDKTSLVEQAKLMAGKRLAGEKNADNQQPLKVERKECSICKAVVSNLQSHFKNKHETDLSKMSLKGLMLESRKSMKLWHDAASPRLSNLILPRLNNDKYAYTVRFDYLIIIYGNKYAEKYQHEDQVDLIKGHMRLLAKLLYEARKYNKDITDLASSFTSKGWDAILQAAKNLSGYSDDSQILKNAYNGLTLGMLIKRCIIRLKRVYCDPKYASKRDELANFLAAFDDDYSSIIISKATATINRNRRKALSAALPTDEDYQKLSMYVQEKNSLCLKSLQTKGFNLEDYVNLVKTTACKLEVFNKRRNLEIERAEIEDYEFRMKIDRESEEFKQLCEADQEKVQNYSSLLFVQGKKTTGIDGAIYLTYADEESLDCITKYRSNAGISKDSKFLFSLPPTRRGIQAHVSCYKVMVEISNECGAKNPNALRATMLRKYATKKYAQMSHTQKTDKFYLHMAHTEATSNRFYNKVSLKDVVSVTNTLEHMEHAATKHGEPTNEENVEITCQDNFQAEMQNAVTPPSRKTRKTWNSSELNDLYCAFRVQIDNNAYPSNNDINEAFKIYPRLKQRGHDGIRSKLQYIFRKGKTCEN